ncbi:dihydropteroate synthase, partial [Rosenbergiella nectarea]
IRAAAAAGAHLINDIRSLSEPGARDAAAQVDLPVCLMHMQGEPKSMQHNPNYQHIIEDVDSFLSTEIENCIAAGIRRENLLIDPGFGFGKTLQHNYELLAKLGHFHHFDLPLLVGMSRKSM